MNRSSESDIRIRIQNDRQVITIRCEGGLRLRTAAASQDLPQARQLECQLQKCKPAGGDFWFKHTLAATEQELQQQAAELEAVGVTTKVISYGSDDSLHHLREPLFLLLAWPFADEAEKHTAREEYYTRLPQHAVGEFSSADDYLFVAKSSAASSWLARAEGWEMMLSESLWIEPLRKETPLQVEQVRIGIDFHWDHSETLTYGGALELFINHRGTLSLLNEIDLEEYLASVNSSEMTADSPLELLKAQTIAARSTLLATRGRHHRGEPFDLCSDDHCQCYHGLKRIQPASEQAMSETAGQLLVASGSVVDARYSKSCGGIVEAYRHVWEERDIPTLVSFQDGDNNVPFPANTEEKARRLIDGDYNSNCNTGQLQLPENLQYADNCFRWELFYANRELTSIVNGNLGTRWKRIDNLVPLERGDSGRIKRLQIEAGDQKRIIHRELTIRRILSTSHLWSSLFYVIREGDGFRLRGAGWGHGVGLCQLGAAAMALRGASYREILSFYYPGSELQELHLLQPNATG
jgi:SpoIID/LytB domain protein